MKRIVYFQGYGLPLTEDYAGGWMTRDEYGNGLYQPEPNWILKEGVQCDPQEYADFKRKML